MNDDEGLITMTTMKTQLTMIHCYSTVCIVNVHSDITNFDDMALADLYSAVTLTIEIFVDDFIACTDFMVCENHTCNAPWNS